MIEAATVFRATLPTHGRVAGNKMLILAFAGRDDSVHRISRQFFIPHSALRIPHSIPHSIPRAAGYNQ